jgi:hypothetical protein
MTEDDQLVRVVLKLPPDVARQWQAVLDSTGIPNPDDAAAAVIGAAYAGISQ